MRICCRLIPALDFIFGITRLAAPVARSSQHNAVAAPTRVGLISLGCAKNLVDAEVMLGSLMADGLEITNEPAEADALIVNKKFLEKTANLQDWQILQQNFDKMK